MAYVRIPTMRCSFCNLVKDSDVFTKLMREGQQIPRCSKCAYKQSQIETWVMKDCLKCDNRFKSTNKFHRVCEGCKGSVEWLDHL